MFKIAQEDQRVVKVFNGVVRRTLGCGKDVLMAKFEYDKGSAVPPHRHGFEQVTTIIKGKQKIVIRADGDEEEFVVESGDTYVVPPHFEHEQITLEDSLTIDSWSMTP